MKKIALLLPLFLFFTACKTPVANITAPKTDAGIELQLIKELVPALTETSGLEFYKGHLITHNDSGDLPTLYFLDLKGTILYSKTYKNMKAVDWEDITKDDTHLYMADIGNNQGNRKDLSIYKIALSDLENENASVEELHISYPDQKTFVKGNQNHAYDAESIVAIKGSLYIFSKDWKNQSTVLYKVDKNQRDQVAQKITSHNVKGLITGATFNGTDTILLCGYNSSLTPFVFEVAYKNGAFEFGEKLEINIEGGAQVEAISYLKTEHNKESYYLSCEATNIQLEEDEALSQAQLYQLKWNR
jgi:hypothetical protein